MRQHKISLIRPRLFSLQFITAIFLAVTAMISANAAVSQQEGSPPGFSKVFAPDTIGPGSTTTLIFTINNIEILEAVEDMAFTDTLPAGVTIADPALASTDCSLQIDSDLSAPDGGSVISFSGYGVDADSVCTVAVNVTGATPGVYTNTSGDLTSSEGNSGPASDDLTVAITLPGFSKSFSPGSVPLGDRSTLTFTIDNTASEAGVPNLDFTDVLPAGLLLADPANASTTCGTAAVPPVLIANGGDDTITLDAGGTLAFPAVADGNSCTVTVDVVATGTGQLHNLSGDLLADFVVAGKATDTLEVTRTELALIKEFVDDPTPPGGTVELKFILNNFDRIFPATGVAFSDTLIADLSFNALLSNDCGGTLLNNGSEVGLSGVTIGAESFCTLRVAMDVDAGAAPGIYTNTTGTITGNIDGSPVIGNMASDDLFVGSAPVLTKEFLQVGTLTPDPVVNSGDDVVLRFTVTNPSPTSMATDVTFLDELTDSSSGSSAPGGVGFLPFPVSVTLPPVPDPPCGIGSTLALVFVDTDRQGLELTSGSLAAGASCTFDVTVTIPEGLAPGININSTGAPSATIDGATETGTPASDTLEVIAAPDLSKEFLDDPVAPGGAVTLEFILTYPEDASSDATAIGFTDDLAAAIAGLTASGLPLMEACDPDGPGGNPGTGTLSGTVGDTFLTLAGATLSPGESCAIQVSLDVPAGAMPGDYANQTSEVSAVVSGLTATSPAVGDDLIISGLLFSKEFIDDPVVAGDTTTLRFTIENIHPTDNATDIDFSDSLTPILPGTPDLTITSTLPINACGGTVTSSGASILVFSDGSVTSGSPACSFDIELLVPTGTEDGTYLNTSSGLTATQGGGTVSVEPAVDTLEVSSNLISLTKQFTDDPVAPGGTVELEFVVTNIDMVNAASDIEFSDDLDAALSGMIAAGPGPSTCTGLTIGGAMTGFLSFSGISLPAGSSCTFSIFADVPLGAPGGIHPNTTSAVTATIDGLAVTGDPATDDLQVVQLLDFSKSFDGPTTATGTANLTFTITNPGSDSAISLAFLDDLDAVISGMVATTLPALPCGPGSSLSGTSLLLFSGGELAPMGATCSFDVEVTVPVTASAGTFANTTSDLTSAGLKVSDPATADLTVEPAPTFNKVFAPDAIISSTQLGSTSTLTFTIDNTASALAAASLDFTDNLPAAVSLAMPVNASTTCSGGTLTAVSGTSLISYSGGSAAAGASCTINVDVTSTTAGMHVNLTGDLTSTSGNSGPATDTLTVTVVPPPTFNKVFMPDAIDSSGQISTLMFTIDNMDSALAANALDFTDNLPANVSIAMPANASTDCTGGILTAAPGTSLIMYGGGSVAAGAMCTISVDVTSVTVGSHVNTTSDLNSTSGNSGPAMDTLNVMLADQDMDTIGDDVDNCPMDPNTDQANLDMDQFGDVCDDDIDGDLVDNAMDNCPMNDNFDQADLDGDGMGNACDLDDDGDMLPDAYELANGLDPLNSFDQLADNDGDGFNNLEEFEFGSDPNVPDTDNNNNGVPDSIDERRMRTVVPNILLPLLLDD